MVKSERSSESRIGFGTSRGAPEWSGGKDLYIGSPVLATGKVSGIFGSVPGVPEGHREGPPTPGSHMGLRGGAPALSGLGKPARQGPCG